jgi:hypothetical protein
VLETLEDLTPWSCTVDEAARAFAPARPLEGTAPTRWGLALTAPDASGVPQACAAEFSWGLLQRVGVKGPVPASVDMPADRPSEAPAGETVEQRP